MDTYLDQVARLAHYAGVDLKDAVLHAGISDSQYYRWINGATAMNERSARRIAEAVTTLTQRSLAHADAAAGR
jgi:ACT domain-containing protein